MNINYDTHKEIDINYDVHLVKDFMMNNARFRLTIDMTEEGAFGIVYTTRIRDQDNEVVFESEYGLEIDDELLNENFFVDMARVALQDYLCEQRWNQAISYACYKFDAWEPSVE